MANRRMINKDDCESLMYKKLTIRQRYLFCHLMLYADDDGVLPVDYVKIWIFPFDDNIGATTIHEDLNTLEVKGYLQLYLGEDGEKYIQVFDWWERQFIDKKIYKPTKRPLPPGYEVRPYNLKKREPSRRYLEQSSKEEGRSGEARAGKLKEEKKKFDKDEDLPFN